MNGKILLILCIVALSAMVANAAKIKIFLQSLDDPANFGMYEVDDHEDSFEKVARAYLEEHEAGPDVEKFKDLRITNGFGKVYPLNEGIYFNGIKKDTKLYISLYGGRLAGAMKHITHAFQ